MPGTQVMLPLIGSLRHPDPHTALVVGLGTGESAGWLAAVDSIEHVDVVELEPVMVEAARACATANHQALDNPKLKLTFDDAREFLLTSKAQYDLIVSEPSNPYRPGIAGLYTEDFYRSLLPRLRDDGLFLQWLQAYEIDTRSVQTVMATLSDVFLHVELWQTNAGDTVFVCGQSPITQSADVLRKRLAEEPYHTALESTWRASDLEGFLSHYLAGRKLITAVVRSQPLTINTDDKNILEYGLGRTLGRQNLFHLSELQAAAAGQGDDRPALTGEVDWSRVAEERMLLAFAAGQQVAVDASSLTSDQQARLAARQHYLLGHLNETSQLWESQPMPASTPSEKRMLAHAYAEQGSLLADPWIARLTLTDPTGGELLSAMAAAKSGRPELAVTRLLAAFEQLRADPWCDERLVDRSLSLALELAATDANRAQRLRTALAEPFAARLLDSRRLASKLAVAQLLPPAEQLPDFLAFEPYIPWTHGFLTSRREVYETNKNPLAPRAARDLRAFEQAADDVSLLPPGRRETGRDNRLPEENSEEKRAAGNDRADRQ